MTWFDALNHRRWRLWKAFRFSWFMEKTKSGKTLKIVTKILATIKYKIILSCSIVEPLTCGSTGRDRYIAES
jgi:hypothetical protein